MFIKDFDGKDYICIGIKFQKFYNRDRNVKE